MYRVVNDFLEDWKYESDATLKIFNNITDKSLNKVVISDGRSIRDIAWHITTALGEMLGRTGMVIENFNEHAPSPEKIEEIISDYTRFSKNVEEFVKTNWSDESLLEEANMYGEMWKKGKVLSVLVGHQAHHRAQLTVLMRQAGLKVPGVYGPSKEEWEAYGMPPQK